MRTDVALEILSDPQSYSFDTVRSAGQHAAHLIASQARVERNPVQSVDQEGFVSELVKRLNLPWPPDGGDEVTLPVWVFELMAEAARTIEALEAENKRLRAGGAWQVKDYADGWTDFATAGEALAEVRAMGGAFIRPIPMGDKHE